jgi:hypothetical protein
MMAIPEACGLWIEQRVEEELADGKRSLRAIGREIAGEVERVFETKVNPDAITKKAERQRREGVTNVTPKSNNKTNSTTYETDPASVTHPPTNRGGKRKGAGRPRRQDLSVEMATEAMQFAVIAISQLSRIRQDDPKRGDALNRVSSWIEEQLKL